MKKTEDDCLIATESKMGWLISGPISKEFESDHTNAMLSLEIHQDEGEKLDEILTKFWEINSVPKTNKDNDNAVQAQFHKSIQGLWQVYSKAPMAGHCRGSNVQFCTLKEEIS